MSCVVESRGGCSVVDVERYPWSGVPMMRVVEGAWKEGWKRAVLGVRFAK